VKPVEICPAATQRVNLSGPGPLDEVDLELLDLLQRNVARTLRDYASS
jgi:hypothetical protein